MRVTAQGPRLRNDLYCVEWDVKLYYTIPYRVGLSTALEELEHENPQDRAMDK